MTESLPPGGHFSSKSNRDGCSSISSFALWVEALFMTLSSKSQALDSVKPSLPWILWSIWTSDEIISSELSLAETGSLDFMGGVSFSLSPSWKPDSISSSLWSFESLVMLILSGTWTIRLCFRVVMVGKRFSFFRNLPFTPFILYMLLPPELDETL